MISPCRITREGDTAVIEYADPSIRTVHLRLGPALAAMTDAAVLERFNAMLEAQTERAASADRTLTEVPPGRPQIAYFERGDQWTPRGEVLRCHIETDAERGTLVLIGDVELDMAAFGRLLATFAGFGMRIAFVDEDDVAEEPEIVVKERSRALEPVKRSAMGTERAWQRLCGRADLKQHCGRWSGRLKAVRQRAPFFQTALSWRSTMRATRATTFSWGPRGCTRW